MRRDGRAHLALRCGVWVGAILTAPLLLVAGGPAHDRLMRHLYRPGGPGLLSKEDGWVHPAYWIVTNGLVQALTWPTRRGGPLRARDGRRSRPTRPDTDTDTDAGTDPGTGTGTGGHLGQPPPDPHGEETRR